MTLHEFQDGEPLSIAVNDRWYACCSEIQADDQTLLTSIHDVCPRFESEIDRLRDLIERTVGQTALALLVVPDHWNESPIRAGSSFARRLREWSDSGNEIFLHGWSHLDTALHAGISQRFRANFMTAREGEFLGLEKGEARRLLSDGRALLEDLTGRPVAGFVAPAWLYSRGTKEALEELEFPIAEDHLRVWQPKTRSVIACGPVITWASRSASRIWSSIAFAAAARTLLNTQPRIRIAVHPGDVHVTALRKSIRHTLAHFAQQRRAGTYADLFC